MWTGREVWRSSEWTATAIPTVPRSSLASATWIGEPPVPAFMPVVREESFESGVDDFAPFCPGEPSTGPHYTPGATTYRPTQSSAGTKSFADWSLSVTYVNTFWHLRRFGCHTWPTARSHGRISPRASRSAHRDWKSSKTGRTPSRRPRCAEGLLPPSVNDDVRWRHRCRRRLGRRLP
jgi:hypothetical protein